MRIKNFFSSNFFLCASGFLFLSVLHFYRLYEVPGLHFDEAWALNFSQKIAEEKQFWPLQAMSPYTVPWTHYWGALWWKIMPGLWGFRFSQGLLSVIGVVFLTRTLWEQKEQRAAALLPWAIAFMPGLLLNHRFAIELNGFHAAILGVCLYAIARKQFLLLALAYFMGVTSHILFYAVGLSFFLASILSKCEWNKKEKILFSGTHSALALFFLYIYIAIPEKGKAAALVLSAIICATFVWLPLKKLFQVAYFHNTRRLPLFSGIFACVFLFNAFFFSEGSWNVAIQTGYLSFRDSRAFLALLFLPILWCIGKGFLSSTRMPQLWFLWLATTLGAMMLKPAPRYFEVLFLAMAVFSAIGMARLSPRHLLGILGCLLVHATGVYSAYFSHPPIEKELRVLLWKDSSRDFLSKQTVVSILSRDGCKFSDIKRMDSRVRESLFALSHADWPERGECSWKNLAVTRRAEMAPQIGHQGAIIADFFLWEMQ